MNETKFQCEDAKAVAEEALWLAWQACGGPVGKGVLQDRPGATKQDVIDNVVVAGDYPGEIILCGRKEGEIRADYVFGRMMKLNCTVAKDGILYRNAAITPDYQAWCRIYPTYEALFGAAIAILAKARGEA